MNSCFSNRDSFVAGPYSEKRDATVWARVSELARRYRVRRAALIRRRTDASRRDALPHLASRRVASRRAALVAQESKNASKRRVSRIHMGRSDPLSPTVLSTSSPDGTPRMQTDVTCRCNMLASTRRDVRIDTNAWHCPPTHGPRCHVFFLRFILYL